MKVPKKVRQMAQAIVREARENERVQAEEDAKKGVKDEGAADGAAGKPVLARKKGIVPVEEMERRPFNTQFVWVGATIDSKVRQRSRHTQIVEESVSVYTY